MRIAVISDIHANLQALQAVYEQISHADDIICLGDVVGYGPQPEETIRFITRHSIACILGNHDLAVHDDIELAKCNEHAVASLRLTRKLLSQESAELLRDLPTQLVQYNALFVHGAPPASVNEYIHHKSSHELATMCQDMSQRVCFVGHTHHPVAYTCRDGSVHEERMEANVLHLAARHILNPGSVGQPRDGDPRARYALYDTDTETVNICSVRYDIEGTVALLRQRGFPDHNAYRIRRGQ